MKLFISPAKSLDYESIIPHKKLSYSNPFFLKETSTIVNELKKLNIQNLEMKMKLSKKLALLNYERNQKLLTNNNINKKACIYTFKGQVYQAINVYSLTENEINTLQNSVLILSGLYGILKPLDLIEPYRLEMGTAITINNSKNLYEYWENSIIEYLNKFPEEPFINLCSLEYWKVINEKKIKNNIINIHFKEKINNTLKTIGIKSKTARGLMTRFFIKKKCKTISDLKKFNENNYSFSDELSDSKNLIFIR